MRDRSPSASHRMREGSPSISSRMGDRSPSPSQRMRDMSPSKNYKKINRSPSPTCRRGGSPDKWIALGEGSKSPKCKGGSRSPHGSNSRMNRDQLKLPMTEWICTPARSVHFTHPTEKHEQKMPTDNQIKIGLPCSGKFAKLWEVFYVQEEYNDHIRERNKTKNCPMGEDMKTRASRIAESPNFEKS